ncbi:MAG: hypothetical protein ACRDV7_08900 [Acidimicrobiia bacterium]
MRVYRKGRAARWAGVVGACNTLLVAAYFLVASAWAETTFFGDQPTPQMEHESSQLETCGMLVLILATPVAAYVA